jgi:predicted dinucleotide-binding enzyme
MTKNTVPRYGVNPTSEPGSPKFCIFGAGAIGGTIAAQLARAGAPETSAKRSGLRTQRASISER